MKWTKLWCASAFVVVSACAHDPQPAQTPAVTAALTREPEGPVTPEETAFHGRFRKLLDDPRPVLDVTADTPRDAAAELEASFARLGDAYRQRGMDASAKVECLRNGCIKEVYFPNQELLQEVGDAIIPRGGVVPGGKVPRFAIARTGRSPRGSGFVVIFAVFYPVKPSGPCGAEERCTQ
jgi:hypothetical protein